MSLLQLYHPFGALGGIAVLLAIIVTPLRGEYTHDKYILVTFFIIMSPLPPTLLVLRNLGEGGSLRWAGRGSEASYRITICSIIISPFQGLTYIPRGLPAFHPTKRNDVVRLPFDKLRRTVDCLFTRFSGGKAHMLRQSYRRRTSNSHLATHHLSSVALAEEGSVPIRLHPRHIRSHRPVPAFHRIGMSGIEGNKIFS